MEPEPNGGAAPPEGLPHSQGDPGTPLGPRTRARARRQVAEEGAMARPAGNPELEQEQDLLQEEPTPAELDELRDVALYGRTAADRADAAALLHALRANPTSAHPPSGSTLLDRARATALASPARSRAATAAAGNPFAATIRVPVSFETCVNPSLLANRLDEEAVLKPRCKPRYS